ncbi:unnamed protein product [Ilex paraguariensis]|uniref:Uncharacterized protein n=1 Tax=Ilex paraguariensis TaxID=185542 RepID=A0ABC8SMV5_9AQUA
MEMKVYLDLLKEPRPLSQLDLKKVVVTSKKTLVAASEYTRLSSRSPGWPSHGEPDDYHVQAAISEISKVVVSQMLNLRSDTSNP